jgi:hypothetical protein
MRASSVGIGKRTTYLLAVNARGFKACMLEQYVPDELRIIDEVPSPEALRLLIKPVQPL